MKYLAVLLLKYILNILAQLLRVVHDISLHLDSREFKQVIYLCWEAASSLGLSFILFVLKKKWSQCTLVLTSPDLHAYHSSVNSPFCRCRGFMLAPRPIIHFISESPLPIGLMLNLSWPIAAAYPVWGGL